MIRIYELIAHSQPDTFKLLCSRYPLRKPAPLVTVWVEGVPFESWKRTMEQWSRKAESADYYRKKQRRRFKVMNGLVKFYIASGLENAALVSRLASVLRFWGWQHTYDWTTCGSVRHGEEAWLTEIAEKEIQGVRDADILIVLLPGHRGTHVELGAALALAKTVFIWAETDDAFDERACNFYYSPNVTRVTGDILRLIEVTKDLTKEEKDARCG